MPKFFVTKEQIKNGKIEITGEDYSHIRTVLRYGENELINVCDGCGTDYKCVIKEITKNSVMAEIIESQKNKGEPKICITLFQAIPKADKMELIIEKCVELGVKRIVPVVAARSIGSMAGKEEKKLERFKRISEAAAKQSGRGIIPEVSAPCSLRESIVLSRQLDLTLVAYENETEGTIRSKLKQFQAAVTSRSIGVYVGPEGGFASDEIELLRGSGASTVTLGSRILRTETAGFAAVAVILYELEG